MFRDYAYALRHFYDFRGRACIEEYSNFCAVHILLPLSLYYVAVRIVADDRPGRLRDTATVMLVVYYLVALVPMFALAVRRAHDMGKKWYYVLIPFCCLMLLCGKSINDEAVVRRKARHAVAKRRKGEKKTSYNDVFTREKNTGMSMSSREPAEETKEFFENKLPVFIDKLIERWEGLSPFEDEGVFINIPGFRNYERICFQLRKALPDSNSKKERQQFRLILAVPADWDNSYFIMLYMKKGTMQEVFDYMKSEEGYRKICDAALELDSSDGHGGPHS